MISVPTKFHNIKFIQLIVWTTTVVTATLLTCRTSKILLWFSKSKYSDSLIILMKLIIQTILRIVKELNLIKDLANLIVDKWVFFTELDE